MNHARWLLGSHSFMSGGIRNGWSRRTGMKFWGIGTLLRVVSISVPNHATDREPLRELFATGSYPAHFLHQASIRVSAPARPTRSGPEDQNVYPIAPVAAVFARRDLEMGGRAPGGTRLRSDSAT